MIIIIIMGFDSILYLLFTQSLITYWTFLHIKLFILVANLRASLHESQDEFCPGMNFVPGWKKFHFTWACSSRDKSSRPSWIYLARAYITLHFILRRPVYMGFFVTFHPSVSSRDENVPGWTHPGTKSCIIMLTATRKWPDTEMNSSRDESHPGTKTLM